jgi:HAD superfamily hydrolase (TIGR01509 family)
VTRNSDVILFDLDGTLVDSHEAIYDSAIHILKRFSEALPTRAEVFQSVGLPIATLFSRFLTEAELNVAVVEFREHLKANGHVKTKQIPGALDLLKKLKKHGFTLILVSNKQSALAKVVLQQQQMIEYFNLIVGADLGQPKPSPEMINFALRKLPSAGCSVMVGDRFEDMLAARDAGIKGIFLENPYTPTSSLNSLWPYRPAIVSNLAEVFPSYLEIKGDVSVK